MTPPIRTVRQAQDALRALNLRLNYRQGMATVTCVRQGVSTSYPACSLTEAVGQAMNAATQRALQEG